MELRRRTALRRCDVPDGALPTNYPVPDPDHSHNAFVIEEIQPSASIRVAVLRSTS